MLTPFSNILEAGSLRPLVSLNGVELDTAVKPFAVFKVSTPRDHKKLVYLAYSYGRLYPGQVRWAEKFSLGLREPQVGVLEPHLILQIAFKGEEILLVVHRVKVVKIENFILKCFQVKCATFSSQHIE